MDKLLTYHSNGASISKDQLKAIIKEGSDNVNKRIVKIEIQKINKNPDEYAITDIQPIRFIVNEKQTSEGGRTSSTRKLYNHKYKRGHKKTHRKRNKNTHRKGIKRSHKRTHKK